LLASPAGAQSVSGRVTEDGSAAPVEGAFVLLVDEEGARQAGALTGPDGTFHIGAPAPGRYRIRVERMAYQTFETGVFTVGEGTLTRDVSLPPRPILLAAIEVEVEPRCGAPSGEATAILWAEARKALQVAQWAEEAYLRFEVATFERTIDLEGRVEEDVSDARSGWGREPFRSLPADSLARAGYVQPIADEDVYFGPDADVLLSDSFLETHCFRAVRSEGRIGLAFEPVPGRAFPDVEGTLWFGPDDAALEELEFRYTGLPREARHPRLGGEVRFERVPGGVWIIRGWVLRTPRLTMVWGPNRRFETEMDGIVETGGTVTALQVIR
jgi:hypothetical protein